MTCLEILKQQVREAQEAGEELILSGKFAEQLLEEIEESSNRPGTGMAFSAVCGK